MDLWNYAVKVNFTLHVSLPLHVCGKLSEGMSNSCDIYVTIKFYFGSQLMTCPLPLCSIFLMHMIELRVKILKVAYVPQRRVENHDVVQENELKKFFIFCLFCPNFYLGRPFHYFQPTKHFL